MKPPAFDYFRPQRLEQALSLLAQHADDARVLAGGQSLMPLLNMRLAQPRALIDIARLAELDYVRATERYLAVGAACTQAKLGQRASLAREVPLLALALPRIAHPQIRNRGTVCGSIAHADPSAELPLVWTALGGEVVLRSVRGARVLAAQTFITGALSTACAVDELIEEVRFPLAAPGWAYAFDEVAMRHGDFALVAIALAARHGEYRVAISGVEDRPLVELLAAASLEEVDARLAELASRLSARDDQHASAAYRRHAVRALTRRMIEAQRAAIR